MRMTTVVVPAWPGQAWLASCPLGSDEVTAYVGGRVEVGPDRFCEAAWAGPFEGWGFDETDVVFGSGGRVRDDRVVFVGSGSTLDRLHSLRTGDRVLVSNSLACLLSGAGGALRLDLTRYRDIFVTVRDGADHYVPDLPTTAGIVRLTYFANLVWDGAELATVEKPHGARAFADFADYRRFLGESLAALTANARDPARQHPFGLISTLSNGYDSSTATVLAHEAGCTDAVSFDRSRAGRDDSGTAVAEALGLQLHVLELADAPQADVLFLAAGTADGGNAMFAGAEALLAGRLVFTGHWGDGVWGLYEDRLDRTFPRREASGSDFAEHRLVAGYLVVPVPYLGGRQFADIRAISLSPELEPWGVPGDYNRPIARRIVEEAGVARKAFGMRKKAILHPPIDAQRFLPPALREDYVRWLRSRRGAFLRRGLIPPSPAWDVLSRLRSKDPARRRRLHKYVVHWAVDRAIERYPRPAGWS